MVRPSSYWDLGLPRCVYQHNGLASAADDVGPFGGECVPGSTRVKLGLDWATCTGPAEHFIPGKLVPSIPCPILQR